MRSAPDLIAILDHHDPTLVLTGQAKTLFAKGVAIGLRHLPAYHFWNEHDVIIGQLTGGFIEGDPRYLGLAAGRVWHWLSPC